MDGRCRVFARASGILLSCLALWATTGESQLFHGHGHAPVPAPAPEVQEMGVLESMIDSIRGYCDPENAEVVSMHQLAMLIDRIDKSLQYRGQVVVKAPDVWGQNKLTQPRVEVEKMLKGQLGGFQAILNGFQSQTDFAAFTNALSLGANIGPKATGAIPDASGLLGSSGGLVANANTLATGTALTAPANVSLPNKDGTTGIGLEPTILLDERSRYLYHLQQLRRINLGDDHSDTPGYSIYMVRTPVSILPGGQTTRGKGAKVTIEAKHALTPDLLPTTFRNVVIIDTAFQLADTVDRGLYGLIPSASGDSIQQATTAKGIEPIARAAFTRAQQGSSTDPSLKMRAASPINNAGRASPAGNASGFSPTEIIELIGEDNLKTLITDAKEDEKFWYRHNPSVLSWLMSECTSAYGYMREQARLGNELFQPEAFESLGRLALDRDFGALKVHREQWLQMLAAKRNESTVKATDKTLPVRSADILCFAMMIQSVLIDRQIKNDMQTVIERNHAPIGDPQQFCFYYPCPDEASKRAFMTYVEYKWPIHVFTLDPVVDQQNQLDLYTQKSQLQLALAVAVASGSTSVKDAASYARTQQQDLNDINLNRTVVGFGAGETTYGWRFYPRLQTPPAQNNARRLAGIIGGSGNEEFARKNLQIEPGIRECYAVIVAPNFIPKIRLTTVSNFFDLKVKHPEQTMETTDMIRLGRKLQTAREAMQKLCDSGKYRPVEVELLADRLKQLEAMLPLQSSEAKLPYEADMTGSEIFSSTASALAPRLITWYGEPVQEGKPSSIFVVGTNITIQETKAIVGGQVVLDDDQNGFDLISRNVLRLVIPANAVAIDTEAPDNTRPPVGAVDDSSDVQTITIAAAEANFTLIVSGTDPDTKKFFRKPISVDLKDFAKAAQELESALNSADALGRVGGTKVRPQNSANGVQLVMTSEKPVEIPTMFVQGDDATVSIEHTTVGAKGRAGKLKKRKVIDIHIASPNGVSNHLLVDVVPASQPAEKTPTPPPGDMTASVTTTTTPVKGGGTKVETKLTTSPGFSYPIGTVVTPGNSLPDLNNLVVPGAVEINGGTTTPAPAPAAAGGAAAAVGKSASTRGNSAKDVGVSKVLMIANPVPAQAPSPASALITKAANAANNDIANAAKMLQGAITSSADSAQAALAKETTPAISTTPAAPTTPPATSNNNINVSVHSDALPPLPAPMGHGSKKNAAKPTQRQSLLSRLRGDSK